MGSNRGGNIVSSLGPVTVVPLPPFEWEGIERLQILPSDIVTVNPVTIVDNAGITKTEDNDFYSTFYVYGSNINKESLISHSFTCTTNKGFSSRTGLVYIGDNLDGSLVMELPYVGGVADLEGITTMDIVSDDGMLVIQLRNIIYNQ